MSQVQQSWDGPERMELKPERIQQLLLRLPGWSLGSSGRAIERRRTFKSVDEAAEFVGFAGRLAGFQRQPLTIVLTGRSVSLTLTGHSLKGCCGGLTNPVFRLAGMLG